MLPSYPLDVAPLHGDTTDMSEHPQRDLPAIHALKFKIAQELGATARPDECLPSAGRVCLRLLDRCQGQPHPKATAFAHDTLHRHHPALHRHKLFHQMQA